MFETKTNLSDETVDVLQGLIRTNIDSRDGFLEAAENVEDSALAQLFRETASQRGDQVSELSSLVAVNSEEPKQSGTSAAAMHRAWMDLRTALGGGRTAVLSEAERGEDHIRDQYQDAIKKCSISPVSDVLHRHFIQVKASHDRIRDLRDAFAASKS